MADEAVKELFVRGCKLAVHHSVGAGKTATEAGSSSGREAQQQVLAQEVQHLRKALQESCALQRRLAASTQSGVQGRALKRKLRKLTHEVGKLKDLLAEREEIMWEKDRQMKEFEEGSPWRDPQQVDSMIHPLASPSYPPFSGDERIVLIGGISRLEPNNIEMQGGSVMTQMLICRLTHCPGHDKTTVVLEDVDRRLELAFVIPVNEAYRLAQVLGLARCTCVPVLELIDGLLAHYNARVLRAVLDGDEVEVSATLYVGENDGEAAFPCHPADALALAERTRAPIYATDEILHRARQLGQLPGRGTGHADGACYPERTRPEDLHSQWLDRH